jgi:hypothetical protein
LVLRERLRGSGCEVEVEVGDAVGLGRLGDWETGTTPTTCLARDGLPG